LNNPTDSWPVFESDESVRERLTAPFPDGAWSDRTRDEVLIKAAAVVTCLDGPHSIGEIHECVDDLRRAFAAYEGDDFAAIDTPDGAA
jgi:hypothetical protein